MDGIMIGKGQRGIKKNPQTPEIPLQSKGPTKTGSGKDNFDVKKKMAKVMSRVMTTKGC